jgi:VWFA-related protein
MNCKNCGAELKLGAKFCPKCGTKVEISIINSNPEGAINQNSEPELENKQVTETYKQESSEEINKITAVKGNGIGDFFRKNKKLIIIAATSSVITIGLVLCILFITGVIGKSSTKAVATMSNVNNSSASSTPVSSTTPNNQNSTTTYKPLTITINQVDNSQFPKMTIYASIEDELGNVVNQISKEAFELTEGNAGMPSKSQIIEAVNQNLINQPISIDLVLAKSDSMNDNDKISKAKSAAISFLSKVNFNVGDQVEVTQFDTSPTVNQYFTKDSSLLNSALNNVSSYNGGKTALYDALYTSLVETNKQTGPKCVIAFTDGGENSSVNCTESDVIDLAVKTGIPVFMIGIGDDSDQSDLKTIAESTGGQYYFADESDLNSKLQSIYQSVYSIQKSRYIIKYTSKNTQGSTAFRDVHLTLNSKSGYSGTGSKEFAPVTVIMQSPRMNSDYILADSSSRALVDSDVSNLSLVELRIARNEIFARHGREFRDRLLAKWFFSKDWYSRISPKYEPTVFDKTIHLSKLERDNISFLLKCEQNLLNQSAVFKNANSSNLTEWDVTLSKAVLQRARKEIFVDAGVSDGNINALNEHGRYNVNLIDATIKQLP